MSAPFVVKFGQQLCRVMSEAYKRLKRLLTVGYSALEQKENSQYRANRDAVLFLLGIANI